MGLKGLSVVNGLRWLDISVLRAFQITEHPKKINLVQSTETTNGMKLDVEYINDCTNIKKKPSSNADTQLIHHQMLRPNCGRRFGFLSPKRVFQEREAAKKDYIRATFGVRKDHKVLLPKIIDSFAKDLGLCYGSILEMIQQSLPGSLRKSIKKCQQ